MEKYLLVALMMIFSPYVLGITLPVSQHPFGVPATLEILNSLGKGLEMPPILSHGQVPVLNPGGGYAIVLLDPVSRSFVEYCKKVQGPILDIGCGYGTISLSVLQETSCTVIAEDIGIENLLVLRNQAQERDYERLFLNCARFPDLLEFPANSLSGVAICQVLHFLTGEEIDQGLAKIYHWLIPGGKLFIVTCSPYVKSLLRFASTYHSRAVQGMRWPGQIEDYASLCPEMPNLPSFFHVMDHSVIKNALMRAGFAIEEMTFVDRRKTIPSVGLDGRESIGVIARKPVL